MFPLIFWQVRSTLDKLLCMYLICALTTDHSMQLLSEQWYENTWITGYKPLHYGGLAVYTPSILVRVYQPDHSSMWCFYLRALSLDVCAEVLRFVQNCRWSQSVYTATKNWLLPTYIMPYLIRNTRFAHPHWKLLCKFFCLPVCLHMSCVIFVMWIILGPDEKIEFLKNIKDKVSSC